MRAHSGLESLTQRRFHYEADHDLKERSIYSERKGPTLIRATSIISLVALFVGFSGCALVPDVVSESMTDPAKYDLFDCKQLEAARKSLAMQAAELEGLIAKAETGAGGSVVAEMAYLISMAFPL